VFLFFFFFFFIFFLSFFWRRTNDWRWPRFLQHRLEASGNRIDIWRGAGTVASGPNGRKRCLNRQRRRTRPITCWARGRNCVAPSRRTGARRPQIRSGSRIFSKNCKPRTTWTTCAVLAFRGGPAVRGRSRNHQAPRALLSSKVRNSRGSGNPLAAARALPSHAHLFKRGVRKAAGWRDRVVEVLQKKNSSVTDKRGRGSPGWS